MIILKNQLHKTLVFAALILSLFASAQTSVVHNYANKNSTEPKSNDLIVVNEAGNNISLSELKGKVVFINFWATWCRPCVEEMPTIAALKNQFTDNDKIVFILLNVEADLTKAKKFMTDRKLDLPVFVLGGEVPSGLFQGAIPTTLIFNKNGDLEANIRGAMNFADPQIYNALNELTKK